MKVLFIIAGALMAFVTQTAAHVTIASDPGVWFLIGMPWWFIGGSLSTLFSEKDDK